MGVLGKPEDRVGMVARTGDVPLSWALRPSTQPCFGSVSGSHYYYF